jgi:phosphoglucomutase
VTRWVEDRANELLRGNNAGVKRVPFAAAIKAGSAHQEDFVIPYVRDLRNVINMNAIRTAGLKLAIDPLGGAANRTGIRSTPHTNWTSPSSTRPSTRRSRS